MPINYIFIDIETTGLVPKEDSILEVSAICVNQKLEQRGTEYHSLVVPPGTATLDREFQRMDPYVQNMHTVSGLWSDLTQAIKLDSQQYFYVVEQELLTWLDGFNDFNMTFQMAGHSINSLDRPFINYWMPKLAAKFSHRTLDISSYARFIEEVCDIPFKLAKPPHRAAEDNRQAVAETKRLRDWIQSLPGAMKGPEDE